MNARACLVLLVLILPSASTFAQEFPEGATAPNAAELKSLMVDKVFSVKTAGGRSWRFEIKGNGYFFLDISPGSYKDSGTWQMEDGKFCTQPIKSPASCNAMRTVGIDLFMKRDNGEIVQFVPQ